MTRFCEPCGLTLPEDSYLSHIMGKKHKLKEANILQKKKLEETGLFIRGVPRNVRAAELRSQFEKFGAISKIDVYGSRAYIYYVEKRSCDEALKHKHITNNKILDVNRRKIIPTSPGPQSGADHKQGQGQKRGFDNSPKNVKSASPAKISLDYNNILNSISAPAQINYQLSTLKSLLLAGDESCRLVTDKICHDLERTLKTAFCSCKLYPFGSMTTGLAFKDSDLDVFADLEIDQSTCLLLEGNSQNHAKQIFQKAKKCLYRRGDIFSNIVAIQSAKTPIIKFVHKPTGISCDLNFKDAVGYCNSGLLRHYLQMNERFFELVFIIKYWSRVHKFCSSSEFSSFALNMLTLSFLLSLEDAKGNKVVPPVQDLLSAADPNDPLYFVQEWRCAFNSSPITIDLPNTPNFMMPGLLKNFFEYVIKLPFETHVISVLTGQLILRKTFEENPNQLPEAYDCYKNHISRKPTEVLLKPEHCVVIHDPFKLNHNLTGRVSKEVLQRFTSACGASAKLCVAAMESDQLQSTLLHQLFLNQKEKKKESTAKGNVIPVLSITSRMPEVFLKDPLQNTTDFFSTILTKILHFQIDKILVGSDVIQSKICKTSFSQAVNEESECTVFVCQGTQDVWNGRKKAQSLLMAKGICFQNPTSFNDEVCISTHLAANSSISSNFSVECRLTCSKLKLSVEFYNVAEGKQGHLNSCMCFVNNVLRRWIFDFSKTFVQEGTSLDAPDAKL